MCFNAKSSFTAWIIAVILSIYLYKRNKNYDRWNAGFILTFTFIQFLEGGVWLSLKYRETTLNSILTTFILISLLYQPFTQSALGYMYSKSPILKYSTLAYALIIGYTLFRIATTPMNNFSSTPGEKGHLSKGKESFSKGGGHLVWNDKMHPNNFLGGGLSFIPYLYLAGVFLPLLFQGWRCIPLIIVGLATAYYSLRVAGKKEFGSYWCFTSVIYALVAILL